MEQGTESSTEQQEPEFEADGGIARGMRTLARNGTVTIAGGQLTLSKGKGDVIVEAPLSEVRAERAGGLLAGASAKVTIGNDTYTVGPRRVHRVAPDRLGSYAGNLARDIKRLKQGRELTQLLLAAIKANGGQVTGD